ncbi:hypothetical protein BGZ95_011424 [Linnemannia exigua]|uniref:F-box/LRR-repeat protein 15/At3g58940/PEG3-like LRR domain-containing protein n=1 Tax=Linnemannia exigua TaxID=604196 RepID=A0AAD4DAG0_9FUNG|nr:hypothetical protein BGZ95_011424 [Linnemannia exigua]
MTPSATALFNQDILHNIFSLGILNQHDLHACCLVNSEWAATGLILLWHYPKCHTLHSFTQLLHTLRHEIDLPGPVVSLSRTPLILADIKHHNSSKHKPSATTTTTTTPSTTATSPPPALDLSAAPSAFSRAMSIRRSSTMRERTSPRSALSHSLSHTPSVSSSFLVPTPYRPVQRREYGIPFHGQRIYHRGQLIRGIDFNALTDSLTLHHFEILARSTRIGFRTLDLRKVRFPFSENLLAILVACTSLKELSLSNIHIPLRAIEFLEPCFSTLTELRLNDCPDAMDDEELTPILRSCPQVKLLEIQGESFTDVSLNWIGTTCLQLESLMIDAPLMTDKTVRHIATNCKKIRHWRLINCLKLEDETTETLEEIYTVDPRTAPMYQLSRETGHIPSLLQTNKLVDAVFRTASGASHMAASSVSATSSTVSSPSTTSISGHSDLDHPSSSQFPFDHHLHQDRLHLSFELDRYPAYANLGPPIGKLTSLELRNCNSIRPETIDSLLKSQTVLEHLVLGGISITEEALESFTQTPQDRLRSLSLLNCGEISDETMMAVMFNCEHLTKLRIFGSHFTLRTFSSISMHLVKLEELHLEHVPLIMNESLQDILLKCTRLRSLKLWHCRNLTHDLFTDISTPCNSLEVLEYMDKHPRPYIGDGWAAQVRFLQSIVIRFESLRVLKLTKLGDTVVPVPLNLVSYLCQLDCLESFTILQNPRIDFTDLTELATNHRTLLHVGVGPSKGLTEQQVNSFNDSQYQPCVRIYKRPVDSSEELERYMS